MIYTIIENICSLTIFLLITYSWLPYGLCDFCHILCEEFSVDFNGVP